MDKYKHRREKLIELKDNFCDGKISELAEKLERSHSYVSRMLYPEGKKGKKRIGDDMVDVIAQAFNVPKSWLDGSDVNIQIGSHFGDNNQFGDSTNFGVINYPSNKKQDKTLVMPDQSLMPWIPQNSEIWLDTQEQNIIDGKIYLIEYGGLQYYRKIFRLPENKVRLFAYNDSFDTFVTDIEQINIIGRVTAWKIYD